MAVYRTATTDKDSKIIAQRFDYLARWAGVDPDEAARQFIEAARRKHKHCHISLTGAKVAMYAGYKELVDGKKSRKRKVKA